MCGPNLLHTLQPISDFSTIHYSIFQDGSKCTLLPLKFLLNLRAVTTAKSIAPGNNRSICKDRSKCMMCGPNLLHLLEFVLDLHDATPTNPTSLQSHLLGPQQMWNVWPAPAGCSSNEIGTLTSWKPKTLYSNLEQSHTQKKVWKTQKKMQTKFWN